LFCDSRVAYSLRDLSLAMLVTSWLRRILPVVAMRAYSADDTKFLHRNVNAWSESHKLLLAFDYIAEGEAKSSLFCCAAY
jgi:hypothetical protein